MNTIEKGDIFEAKSLAILQKLIEDETLYISKDQIKIRKKQGYYSKDREKDIIFDLTIEVWPPGADRYVSIYIIECKNYKYRVPISKVEDFHSKILQVSGVNAKGIFVTNSPLQEAAYTFAKNKGMMVIQGDTPENAQIVLYKKSKTDETFKIPMLYDTINDHIVDSGILLLEKIIDKAILNALSEEKSDVAYNIDKLLKEDIEKIADNEINQIDENVLINAEGLSVKLIETYIAREYRLAIGALPYSSTILGACDMNNNQILIHPSLHGTNRHLFVLCHEFGHFILHQKLTMDQMTYDLFEDTEYNFKTGKHDLLNPKHWIEWQANYFASCLILNKVSLYAQIFKCQNRLGISKGPIILNDSYQSRKMFNQILYWLSNHFNTSKTTIIYKMKEHKFLKEQFKTKSVGELIQDYKRNYFI